jgi:hypothetical protein
MSSVGSSALENYGTWNTSLGMDKNVAIVKATQSIIKEIKTNIIDRINNYAYQVTSSTSAWSVIDVTTGKVIYKQTFSEFISDKDLLSKETSNTKTSLFVLALRRKVTSDITKYTNNDTLDSQNAKTGLNDNQLKNLQEVIGNDSEVISNLYEALYVAFTKQYDSDDYYIVKTTLEDGELLSSLSSQMNEKNFSSLVYTKDNTLGKTPNTKVVTDVADTSKKYISSVWFNW